MAGARLRKEQPGRQPSGLARLGQDAQAFGEEQPFLAAMALLAESAHPLDQRVGKGGDLARHQSSPNLASTSSTSVATAASAPSPSALIVIVSPIAAPSIISPMIEVPVTAWPSLATATSTGCDEARVTNLALALACNPRLLVMSTDRSARIRQPPRRAPRKRPRYICARPRARRLPRRSPSSPCAHRPAESASAG